MTSSLRLAAILISSRPIMLSHTVLESIGHFTPELLISALCDVTMNNLAYLTVSVLPSWPVWKFLLLVYFSSWVESLFVFGCCPSLYVTLWILHVSHASQGSAKQNLFLFVGCSHGFRDLWSNPFLLSRKVSWMEVCSEIYDWWLRVARTWGLAIVLLD